MEYLTGNLAMDCGNSILNKAIDYELKKRGHIPVRYIPSELEIQVVNQATCEHEIKVEADEAYCPRCLKQLILADFGGEE